MLQSKAHPLKVARKRRNITQQELADFTGLGIATIQRAERGQKLRADVRKRLCEFLGKSSEELGLLSDGEAELQTDEAGQEPDSKPASEAQEPGTNDVDRRDFLQTVGIAGARFLLPSQQQIRPDLVERFLKALKQPSTIDETTLNHFETLAQSSWQLIPDITGVVSKELRGYTVNQLHDVTEMLDGPL